ncbi:polysaccharide pyruvyl transferase family protein [Arcobacter sp. KX21116]|uniref:polysaccharide pyruvyl transferase family protein n=1 Tax=Arcobacter iocasae TaxID=2906515 RepID=UPI0035D4A5CC
MKYFLYGYYGFENFGDDLLLKTIIDEISLIDNKSYFFIRNNKEVNLLKNYKNILFTNLEQILQKNGSKIFNIFNYFKETCKYIKRSDVFLIGAGGLFLDKGKFNKSIFILLLFTIYSKLLNKKIIIFGVSLDILASPMTLFLVKNIFKLANFVAVRDGISYSYLKYIIPQKSVLSSDIVFLTKELIEISENSKEDNKNEKTTLGLCLIDYFNTYEFDLKKDADFKNKILKNLKRHENKYKYIYIAFQEEIGQRDNAIFEYLVDNGINMEYKLINNFNSINSVKEVDFIITMRYHLAIIGYILQKKILIIDHELKMSSLSLELDLPSISIDNVLNCNIDLIELGNKSNTFDEGTYRNMIKKSKLNFKWMMD